MVREDQSISTSLVASVAKEGRHFLRILATRRRAATHAAIVI